MKTRLTINIFAIVSMIISVVAAQAAPSSQELNRSNNPLTAAYGVNLQNYYTGSYYGGLGNSDSNAMLLRGIVPHELFGAPQIMRATVPMMTSPDDPSGSTTGLGDINAFNIFLVDVLGVQVGIGPQLTVPSATDNRLGTDKWQGGTALAIIEPKKWGLLGALITWQQSFAGDSDRPDQNSVQGQPFFIHNLADGFYARSTAVWNFDLETGSYAIPVGAGGGKAWKLEDGTVLNVFLEPQWSLLHDGVVPQFQLFAGLNLQFK